MTSIYREVAKSLSRKGLSYRQSLRPVVSGAAPVPRLPAHELPMERIACHPSRTRNERQEAFSIRKGIFVQEQKLFKRTDVDEHDNDAIHLVGRI